MDVDEFILNTEETNEIIGEFDNSSIDKLFDDFYTSPNEKTENNMDVGLLNISMEPSSSVITKQSIQHDSSGLNEPSKDVEVARSPQFNESLTKSHIKNSPSTESTDGTPIENTDDDIYTIRHERALQEERKKFSTYLKYPFSTRSRANRRADSLTNSSGANTPDPSSPATTIPNIGVDNEVTDVFIHYSFNYIVCIHFSQFHRHHLKDFSKVLRMTLLLTERKNEARGKELHLLKRIQKTVLRQI